ncbi:MAG: lysoplasmalogenase [Bacteroidetes bacterium]|nr:lysoplasmalogenase [Bacteroidota bacterium]MBS1592415.1 lysoplasmalogenase [Bacteroidota bacterium]MBS1639351.1 lysoplasmalogenase [Bacteroidota bacterium]
MQLLKQRGILIFWAVLLLDCYCIYSNNHEYRLFTKTLLVPLIGFFIFLNARRNAYPTTKTLLFFALIAAWIGDILLLNNGSTSFLLGMGCFFIFHVLIGIVFYRLKKLNLEKCQEAFLALIVFIVAAIALLKFLKYSLPHEMKVPVIIYMVGLAFMLIMVANQMSNSFRRINTLSFFLPAAALFIGSDGILVVSKYRFDDIPFLDVVVMLSYGYALALLGQGFTKMFKG